jgi:hypothetical protein
MTLPCKGRRAVIGIDFGTCLAGRLMHRLWALQRKAGRD